MISKHHIHALQAGSVAPMVTALMQNLGTGMMRLISESFVILLLSQLLRVTSGFRIDKDDFDSDLSFYVSVCQDTFTYFSAKRRSEQMLNLESDLIFELQR